MNKEAKEHRERLKILEKSIGNYYYMIGNIHIGISDAMEEYHKAKLKLLGIGVVNCVYVVTERDNHGEKLFKGVFSTREKALQYLAEDGLKESNIDEINEIELD